jgi:hypothetical protein
MRVPATPAPTEPPNFWTHPGTPAHQNVLFAAGSSSYPNAAASSHPDADADAVAHADAVFHPDRTVTSHGSAAVP